MRHGKIRNFELLAAFGWATVFMVFALIALMLMKVL